MNEGAKAKFIIPSHLAYGEDGSSTGIIPPYTTVIYEIELLNLTKKQ
jgi:FKBP-type peptidyl-prolyl cis-trans isomerase